MSRPELALIENRRMAWMPARTCRCDLVCDCYLDCDCECPLHPEASIGVNLLRLYSPSVQRITGDELLPSRKLNTESEKKMCCIFRTTIVLLKLVAAIALTAWIVPTVFMTGLFWTSEAEIAHYWNTTWYRTYVCNKPVDLGDIVITHFAIPGRCLVTQSYLYGALQTLMFGVSCVNAVVALLIVCCR